MSIRSPALLLLLPVIAFGCAEKPRAEVPRTPDPVQFLAASEIAQVALGWDDLCVRLQNGRVLCKKDWRPEGARSPVASFLAVHGVYDAVDVSLGAHHACVRRIPGTVECWGDNASGEVGDATQIARTPHLVQGISSGVAEVKLGESQTCARLVDGTVRCWGSIAAATRVPPVAVKGLSKVVGIALGRGWRTLNKPTAKVAEVNSSQRSLLPPRPVAPA